MITNYNSIPKFPNICYAVDVHWAYLESNIERFIKDHKLQLEPDFQRGHVWTKEQRSRYIEFMLKKGESGRDVFMNHPGWMGNWKGDFVLVDGLQRLTSIRMFVANKLKAYDRYASELGNTIPFDYRVRIHIAKLQTRAEVLQWYLDFNAGGTPHSKEEIDKVRKLLKNEKA